MKDGVGFQCHDSIHVLLIFFDTATVLLVEKDRESIQPDIVPVGFDFDGDHFYVGGVNLLKSTKFGILEE